MRTLNVILASLTAFLLGLLLGLRMSDAPPPDGKAKPCQCNGHCGGCK